MNEGLIACPNCGHEFEMSEALAGKLRAHLKTELQEDIVRREAEVKKRQTILAEQEGSLARQQDQLDELVAAQLKEQLSTAEEKVAKEVEGQYVDQLNELKETLEQRDSAIKELRDQERDLRKEQRELKEAKESFDLEVSRTLDRERDKLRDEAAKKIAGEYADQLQEMNDNIDKQSDTISELRKQEVELRKAQRALEEAKEASELEIARKLDEERGKIREEATSKYAEEHRLKDLEKDKVVNDLRTSLEDMKRKAEQGSMEIQGEVLEQDFEAQLRSFFPHDAIQPVPKGVRGADLVHSVRTLSGAVCGVLLWETKNTKAWSPQWIPKLKDDMVEIRANIGVLASVVIPPGIERFGQMDGVWVADPVSAIPLAAVLREQLIAVNRERTAAIGKGEKTEMLYQYLAGNEFKQKIEGIVEAFTTMQAQINQERRAMEKHWKQRQKQIERVVKNTAGLYGDMQGIIGGQIPIIPSLELEGGGADRLTAGSEAPAGDNDHDEET